MTEAEMVAELAKRMAAGLGEPKNFVKLAWEVVRLMRYAAETARVKVDLTTSGKVYVTEFVPGLPE